MNKEFLRMQKLAGIITEATTPPTFERLKDWKSLKGYDNSSYKIVKFAYDDEGSNGFALLDMDNKKLISWSLSGSSEREKFDKLVKN